MEQELTYLLVHTVVLTPLALLLALASLLCRNRMKKSYERIGKIQELDYQ